MDTEKIKLYGKNFYNAIKKDTFPKTAIISEVPNSGGYSLKITWKLPTLERPNRPSKSIMILISEEALEKYKHFSSNERDAVTQQFRNWVNIKLCKFDPRHDTSYEEQPPCEEWIFKEGDLQSENIKK